MELKDVQRGPEAEHCWDVNTTGGVLCGVCCCRCRDGLVWSTEFLGDLSEIDLDLWPGPRATGRKNKCKTQQPWHQRYIILSSSLNTCTAGKWQNNARNPAAKSEDLCTINHQDQTWHGRRELTTTIMCLFSAECRFINGYAGERAMSKRKRVNAQK